MLGCEPIAVHVGSCAKYQRVKSTIAGARNLLKATCGCTKTYKILKHKNLSYSESSESSKLSLSLCFVHSRSLQSRAATTPTSNQIISVLTYDRHLSSPFAGHLLSSVGEVKAPCAEGGTLAQGTTAEMDERVLFETDDFRMYSQKVRPHTSHLVRLPAHLFSSAFGCLVCRSSTHSAFSLPSWLCVPPAFLWRARSLTPRIIV